jgi:hypothetical protein
MSNLYLMMSQLMARQFSAKPNPIKAPTVACVVDTGMDSHVATSTDTTDESSIAKAYDG